MAFGTSIKLGNIKENWLFKLSNNNSGFLYFAFSDVTYSSNFYYGVILNNPNIKESIDLSKSTASTSGISIDIPDFKYKGGLISSELFGGTNSYINRECTVHAQINADTPNQIGSFRIVGISSNGNKINIKMNSHRPWDFITIPDTRTTERRKLVPVAYGNYTRNTASNQSSPQYVADLTSYSYRPVNFNKLLGGFALYPETMSQSDDSQLAVYNEQYNVFIPCANPQSATTDLVSVDNSHQNGIESNAQHVFKVSPDSTTQIAEHNDVSVSNIALLHDNNVNSKADFSLALSSGNDGTSVYFLNIDLPEKDEKFKNVQTSEGTDVLTNGAIDSTATTLNVDSGHGLFVGSIIKIKEEIMLVTAVNTNALTITRGNFQTTAINHGNDVEIQTTKNYNILSMTWKWDVSTGGNSGESSAFIAVGTRNNSFEQTVTADVAKNTISFPFSSGTDKIKLAMAWSATFENITGVFSIYDVSVIASREFDAPPKKLYVASDGLEKGITGETGTIQFVHDAHLDLLNRFTGLDVATNPSTNIDGFSDLDTDRNDWDIRIWINEEMDLKKALEKLQFEGCFIFRYKQGDSSQPQYIHIKDSYSSSEVTTLSKNDINNVNLKHVDFSEIITSMIVNFGKHPALAEHRKQETHKVDATRTKFNILAKENIKTYTLDYVKNPNDVEFDSNTLQTFISYYYNLYGDVKLEISFNLVNSAYYDLEVGKVITFDNNNMYPETPFGYNSGSWTNINFMIVDTSRTKGKIIIKARQIS